ncbi:hypothetical protein CAPTEDRAFT_222446 [Capitella teleta]|uniref:Myotubularin phosphatase domain-containing protein n=1 Tax=Capitella teleta TaxID=283909 RepID=R7V4M1_CAPTE|nr:hypothetical protein CAPTEDRAFT_222446 [Capitella teleta]|eukprot:ELU13417.1 hypothetical protein CAPTEDRAFT_222446 [Capitella teleta]
MPKANKATFKSYVEGSGKTNDGCPQEPSLLPGELVITVASQVLRFIPFGEQKQGLLGNLQLYTEQRNRLVGSDDIVLNNVDAVYQVSKGRKKLLVPGIGSTTVVKNLEIHCKDFQIHNFSLKATPKDEAKRLINAIVHHTMPSRHDLLFAFEYRGDAEPDDRIPQVSRFNGHWDWEAEMSRLQAKGFKVIDINTRFQHSENLPESFVVPSSLSNNDILLALTNFANYRCPTWSYSHSNGAALVRMPFLLPNSEMEDLEAKMLTAVKISHPEQKAPKVYSLLEMLPTIRDIQVSYEKLRVLCMPTTLKDVESTDVVWYSELCNTKWMYSVYTLLKLSLRIVDYISNEGFSVVIKEKDSRDLSPLVACLVQLLLDPHTRTIQGFQSLVEREWVAMGHRFKDRLGLVHGTEAEKSPIFLLFLDCVWQLLQQFPSAFQFSEMYLTSIWDSACFGLFENFLFNCSREHENAKSDTRLIYGASSSSNKLLNPAQLSYFETPISVYLENSFVHDGLSMEDSCSLGPDETLS